MCMIRSTIIPSLATHLVKPHVHSRVGPRLGSRLGSSSSIVFREGSNGVVEG